MRWLYNVYAIVTKAETCGYEGLNVKKNAECGYGPGRMATTHLLARTMAVDAREKSVVTPMLKKLYEFSVEEGAGGEPERAE